MKFKIKKYSDPGHGWGAVKRQFLVKNGLLESISYFSHQKGATVYLEEDRDLTIVLNFLLNKGIDFELVEKHTDKTSPIRSYPAFGV